MKPVQMVDWHEQLFCAMCGAWRETWVGPFDEDTGREAICCRVCDHWIRWFTDADKETKA